MSESNALSQRIAQQPPMPATQPMTRSLRPHLFDARSVKTDPGQRSWRHRVPVQVNRVCRIGAVPVSQQQVLGPGIERRRHLYQSRSPGITTKTHEIAGPHRLKIYCPRYSPNVMLPCTKTTTHSEPVDAPPHDKLLRTTSPSSTTPPPPNRRIKTDGKHTRSLKVSTAGMYALGDA